MTIDSGLMQRAVSGFLANACARVLPRTALALCLSVPLVGHAQDALSVAGFKAGAVSGVLLPTQGSVCGKDEKAAVAKQLAKAANASEDEKLAVQAALYDEYKYCADDAAFWQDAGFYAAARRCGAEVSNEGSLFYEEMSCCGYDPQRRQFGCPVTVKQTFGFGGAPLPGSREYVLHCVADATGSWVPVARDSVHLADEMHGQNPSWQFAVIANANNNLDTLYPMDGATRRARSILSWGLEPTSCNYQPIWGNALNYRIRLDQ